MLDGAALKSALDQLALIEPAFGEGLRRIGYPEPRLRSQGYETLIRTIVGQQVSVASAAAIWRKLEAAIGVGVPAERLLASDFDALRTCGLSRQKQGYARSLAELTLSGALDFHNLPADDEAAIDLLTRIKGVGRWSAEIYLLFAEGRPDAFPAGDLAVQIEIGRLLGLPNRPSEKQLRLLAEPWRPWRGAAAIFAWHHYNTPVF
ncbi:MAG TPA: DNA-3-methyladenine glycosylase 2 family protein [Sphingobium sp.]